MPDLANNMWTYPWLLQFSQIQDASSLQEFSDAIAAENIEHIILYVGAVNLMRFDRKSELVAAVLRHSINTRLASVYKQ